MLIYRERAGRIGDQDVAVWPGLRDVVSADITARAAAILDKEGLSQAFAQGLG
jgi:hypothetical protein